MLKILMHGVCGKMGRMVVECAKKRDDLSVVCGVDAVPAKEFEFPVYRALTDVTEDVDVIIDFSRACALEGLIRFAEERKIACVIASTGLTEEQKELMRTASAQIPVFYSANFSLGVNVLLSVCRRAAAALGESFDIEIVEKHHNQKVDAPSGTALMLADGIATVLEDKPEYVFDRHARHEARGKQEIGITAVRGGTIVGEHDVIFAGSQEVVTLSHTAYSREIFANGALSAARFLFGREAGLYDMESMIEESVR